MKDIKVSVVVPIYNVELYLDKCIESIVNQSYKNLEIILIDDGSLDNCPKMCDDWKKKDNRIKVIHKKNAGLGNARNTGIKYSNGDYICFIDSDDIIDKDTIEICCNKLSDYNYDIVHYGFKKMDLDDIVFKYYPTTASIREYVNRKSIEELLPKLVIGLPNEFNLNVNLSACMCLIRLDLIKNNKWQFVSERDIISEDVYSLLHLYKYIESCYILENTFYSYRLNPKSLTTTYREDRYEKVKILHKELINIYPENKLMIKRFDYLFLSYTIACIKSIVSCKKIRKYKFIEIKKIIYDNYFASLIKKYISIETLKRKIYFKCILLKNVRLIYFLTWLQNKK